jgi:hypothetical protein
MENNENVGIQIGAVLTGIANLKTSGCISEGNLDKANAILAKFLDKLDVCVDKMDLCGGGDGNGDGGNGDGGNGGEYKPLAFVGFSVNLYSETTEGAQFIVSVDGQQFEVQGAEAKSGVAMHNEMKSKLENNPNFDLKFYPENGSPTNYAYVLYEKVSGSLAGKEVSVIVSNMSYGNITINGNNTDQMQCVGQFIYSN